MNYIAANRLMGYYALINVFILIFGAFFPSYFSAILIGATSFFMAPMFPTIFALSVKDLGKTNTKLGGSVVIMSIIGGAIITPLMGITAERTESMALSMLIPSVCFGYVAYYGFIGYKQQVSPLTVPTHNKDTE